MLPTRQPAPPSWVPPADSSGRNNYPLCCGAARGGVGCECSTLIPVLLKSALNLAYLFKYLVAAISGNELPMGVLMSPSPPCLPIIPAVPRLSSHCARVGGRTPRLPFLGSDSGRLAGWGQTTPRDPPQIAQAAPEVGQSILPAIF